MADEDESDEEGEDDTSLSVNSEGQQELKYGVTSS